MQAAFGAIDRLTGQLALLAGPAALQLTGAGESGAARQALLWQAGSAREPNQARPRVRAAAGHSGCSPGNGRDSDRLARLRVHGLGRTRRGSRAAGDGRRTQCSRGPRRAGHSQLTRCSRGIAGYAKRDLPATRDFWRWRDDGADLPKGKICHACILDRIKAPSRQPGISRKPESLQTRTHEAPRNAQAPEGIPAALPAERQGQGKREGQCRRATTDRRTLEYRQARRAQQQSVVTLVAYLDRSQRLADALGIDVHELDRRNFADD